MPANLVNAEQVSVTRGTTLLLDGVSLGVGAGQRVGVVGRNGSGKSTLVQVLTGQLAPDAGRVTSTGGLRVGVLAQADELPAGSRVGELVAAGRAEHEWAGDPLVRAVVAGLLPDIPTDRSVDGMSGGERRRVALAAVLAADVDLVVLDEPTNHLDVSAIDWLGRHLAQRRSALLVVTHDRWFLDTVATLTWEVVDGRVESYEGGYAAYVLARAERARLAEATAARRDNLLRKELAWLRRGAPARSTKPRYRVAAAQALIADEPPPRDRMELSRLAATRLGKQVVDLERVGIARGGRTIFRSLDWQLGPGDRIGVVGANGSGKTTLLQLLAGRLGPDTGEVRTGTTVRPALLSQEVTVLDPDQRVLESVEEVSRTATVAGGREVPTGTLLERFGFTGTRQWTRVADLSGGERRRLALLRLLLGQPNLLLLDEPTNDLDIDVLTVLEDALDGWAGTLVVVSHDRWFLERVSDTTVALFGDARLVPLVGGVAEYLERAESPERPGGAADGAPPRRSAGDSRAARKELTRLERALERIGRREEKLHAEIAAAPTDVELVRRADEELRSLAGERDETEEAWLLLAEEVG